MTGGNPGLTGKETGAIFFSMGYHGSTENVHEEEGTASSLALHLSTSGALSCHTLGGSESWVERKEGMKGISTGQEMSLILILSRHMVAL